MDAADLDYRARTLSGCIPPHLVSRLLELSHAEEVEFQAGRGEWFCAQAHARLLGEQGRHGEALEVLAPYVATGWWEAAETTAELLEEWGRPEEAIALVRPYAGAGGGLALGFFGRLLARHGRGDEAFSLLGPHIGDWFLAAALVEVAGQAGRDEDAATLLAARIEALPHCDISWCHRHGVEPFVGLLAVIHERNGRIDQAVALLQARDAAPINNRDRLADLLARHGRIEELRRHAAADFHGHAVQRLAEVLEERGDVEGAIAVFRQPGNSPIRESHGAVHLAWLLMRHGRGDEAIKVMRTLADSPAGTEDWNVDVLCTLYAEQGRGRDGLAYLDDLKARRGEEGWDFFRLRLPLMVACGARDEAIAQARAHPEGGTWYAARSIAELLAGAGRTEEAVAVLEPHSPTDNDLLAWHLIGLGRVKDAVTRLQQCEATPVEPAWTDASDDEPPF
ncbi:hypothetical protein [Yinghuangia sp. YIM S10712]|uniref:tetratricopeptide repeat protein n=1 Tax=Yinghuangia sp. YIM S10712 TaxID=3436930 RepID=UPI003F533CC3